MKCTKRLLSPPSLECAVEQIHRNNLKFIEQTISEHETTIWAAWGTLIEKRPYLTKCLIDIYNLSSNYNCNWVNIGKKSNNGHPHHQLYLGSNELVDKFKIREYIEKFK